jgi:outer membrane lipoprotein-sorting protein
MNKWMLLAVAALACGQCAYAQLLSASQPAPAATATEPTAASAAASAPATDPAVMAILQRLESANARFPNLSADLDYHADLTQLGDTEERKGRVYYQADAGAEGSGRFRVHFDNIRQGEGPRTSNVEDYVFDGQWLTVRKEKVKQMTRRQVAPPGEKIAALQLGEGPFPIPFGQKADNVLKFFAVTTRPLQAGEPADTDYLKLVTRPERKDELKTEVVEMWVNKSTGLPVKIIAKDTSENITTVIFGNIKTDKLPEETFNLPQPPSGWEYHVTRYGEQ